MSHWTGAAIIAQCSRTKTCIVTQSRTSTGPTPSSLAGWDGAIRQASAILNSKEIITNPRRNTMIVEAQVTINGSKAAIWAAITDIENASETISGIENIEVIERPANGLVGLRWRETRMYFGKPAAVEKWITDAAENEFYKTRAESDGFVFISTMSISEGSGGITLTSSHDSKPQGIVAKLRSTPMFLFKGVVKKALLQDLNDIKSAVEQESSIAA